PTTTKELTATSGNTPGVKHLPELLSHTYRNRVPKPSNSNRNPNVKHEPESHNSLASLMFPKVFPSGMKMAPGEISEGHFRW
uniref:hypothetical protein n=1 Tax=Mycobacterium marinum TaxID=1781 RepID=UPI001CA49926